MISRIRFLKVSLVLGALSLTGVSCVPGKRSEEKGELRVFKISNQEMSPLINDKPMPNFPDLTSDKTLLNRDYPIEVALYNDGTWFYDLPNLDTGKGTWKMEGGVIKLFASHTLFDMHIDIVATEEGAKSLVLKFRDRFGPRVLETEKINMNLD